MIVLYTALEIEEYFKSHYLLKPETLGKMIHILKDHKHKILGSRYLLRNSEFNGDHH